MAEREKSGFDAVVELFDESVLRPWEELVLGPCEGERDEESVAKFVGAIEESDGRQRKTRTEDRSNQNELVERHSRKHCPIFAKVNREEVLRVDGGNDVTGWIAEGRWRRHGRSLYG